MLADAQEPGDVRRGGPRVDLLRRADLLDRPSAHHRDPVGHGERLLLVVRHVDERDADLALELPQLELQVLAELGVERAERLVEQQHLRVEHQRPGQGDALLLAAGELRRTALGEIADADELERLADAAVGLVLRGPSGSAARRRRCPRRS